MTLPEVILLLMVGRAHAADPEALLRAGDVASAVSAARGEARAHPDDLAAQELYVDLLLAIGQSTQALEEARARAAADPRDADVQYLLGRATLDPAAAQRAYEAALKLEPEHARAGMGLASIAEARGQLDDALAGYTRAIGRDGSLGEAWIGRVRVLLRLGRKDEALAVARQGLAARPSEVGLVLSVAQLAPGDALAVLQSGLQRVPDEPRLHEALAARKLETGDFAGALAAANAALAIDPTLLGASRTALYAKELVEGRLDADGRKALDAARSQEAIDPKGAVARYPALVSRYPRSALVLLGRGAARKAAGDAAALDDLVQAAKLDPANTEAVAAAGLALVGARRTAEAEPLLKKAAAARPWDPGLAVAWIAALEDTGRAADALSAAAVQAGRFPYEPRTQLVYAELLVDANRTAEAYDVVRPALLATGDPQLAAAFVRIATAAGHPEEAAALLDKIVASTGNPQLAEAAKKLRGMKP